MLARVWVFFPALAGSAFGVNSSNVDFTISYTLSDVRFHTGPNAGLSALGGGADYDFYTDISHEENQGSTAVGSGSHSASSAVTVNSLPFDPDIDPFFEGDFFDLSLEAASSADSPGSNYGSWVNGRTDFSADLYTIEGLEFVWDFVYTVATTVDNNDPDGGVSQAFADASVDWSGEITPVTTLTFVDLGYGDLCCGTPTNPGESLGGQFTLALAPGEFVANFSFLAVASTFNTDLVPEPGVVLLTLAGAAFLVLRRRR
jgi:hypothetical protein